MKEAPLPTPGLSSLLGDLDSAVATKDPRARCQGVKSALVRAVSRGNDFVPATHLTTSSGGYARHLLHRDPDGAYSVLAMVWGAGQGTPLHDHAGRWCVECVYRGRIRVVSYRLERETEEGRVEFEEESEVFSAVGDAGALIPPFEYHLIENAEPTPSVTLHVYAGEMTLCNTFVPLGDGLYERVPRRLAYT